MVRRPVAEPGRAPGGGGAAGEGLGRSRGGFTSKLHLSADGLCRPLSLIVTAGQRADCTQFKPVLEKIRVPRIGPGRPRKKPDSLAADKAEQRTVPRVPAAPWYPAHDPGEDRQPGRPPTQRHTGRTATRLRRGSLQAAQHSRADDQPLETVPGRRHALRQARLRLPRHRDSGSPHHLATNLIGRTSPSSSRGRRRRTVKPIRAGYCPRPPPSDLRRWRALSRPVRPVPHGQAIRVTGTGTWARQRL